MTMTTGTATTTATTTSSTTTNNNNDVFVFTYKNMTRFKLKPKKAVTSERGKKKASSSDCRSAIILGKCKLNCRRPLEGKDLFHQ